MTGHELRTQFLDFFAARDSLVVPSGSLIPPDPTTLLTTAGMQPFVPYFKGEEEPPSRRLASCQKCCRADDLDEVGVTWRHGSFFEMLGNFSFGDYFKREAINWAWEFFTKNMGMSPDVLWITIHTEDEEAADIWRNDIGLSSDRVIRLPDNWWGLGRGPCGPCSEIHYDRGPAYNTGDPELDRPGGEGDRYGELWNLVFQQYNQQEDGSLPPLPAPGIDTGMGLERLAVVMQGVKTIHHTDLFVPIIRAIANVGMKGELGYSTEPLELAYDEPTTKPLKVIADHIRAATFMAADGITPGRNGRDYMMRRLIRRAYLTGRELGYNEPFLHRIVPVIVKGYGAAYPEVAARQGVITELIRREEERFATTLEAGIERLEELIAAQQQRGDTVIPGAEVFRLYETYGFPRELTAEMAGEKGLSIDEEGYGAAAEKHSSISGSGVGKYQEKEFGKFETVFVGYDHLTTAAEIVAFRAEAEPAGSNRLLIVLDKSPFYAESGGQVGDTGLLEADEFSGRVVDTQKQGKTWVHTVEPLQGEARTGLMVQATVDGGRRQAIERAHSATHILHAALREHLGSHVEQRGSLVEPDRLRFDFVHFSPVTPEQMALIEDTMNAHILRSDPVNIKYTDLNEARAQGAMALFGEKYGDVVRTVRMGDFSLELCGGTHLGVTSAAGFCRVTSEGGVGSNLRRIEALTGAAALQHGRATEQRLHEVARTLGTPVDTATGAAERLRQRVKDLEKQVEQAQRKIAGAASQELLGNATEVNGVRVAAARAPEGINGNALRDMAQDLAQKLDGVVILAGEADGKVLWAVSASASAVGRGAHAGNAVRELAKITGGGGGGRAELAQAGGKDPAQIDAALAQAGAILGGQIK